MSAVVCISASNSGTAAAQLACRGPSGHGEGGGARVANDCSIVNLEGYRPPSIFHGAIFRCLDHLARRLAPVAYHKQAGHDRNARFAWAANEDMQSTAGCQSDAKPHRMALSTRALSSLFFPSTLWVMRAC